MDIAPQKTFPNQPMKMTLSRFIRRIRLLDLFLPIPSSLSALSPSLILEYKNKKIKSSYFCKQKRKNSRPSRIKIKNPVLLASKFKKRERERDTQTWVSTAMATAPVRKRGECVVRATWTSRLTRTDIYI